MRTNLSRRAKAKVSYAAVLGKYDKCSFISPKAQKRQKIINLNAANGRANAAPPLTSWPFQGIHQDVTYHDDLRGISGWGLRTGNEVFLPFAWLDIKGSAVWQGLEQEVPNLAGDVEACLHFDAIAKSMRSQAANTRITECVGEAAAAICVLGSFPGFRMVWGYHIHSGTGIDQIWECGNAAGGSDFLIVEAKGPGAGVGFSVYVPPGYSQMEEGWVANHLYSMNNNSHAAGQRIVQSMGLKFENAHPNYLGASKSYYGLSQQSQHKASASRLYGVVVTARWLSDGRLSYARTNPVQYFT